MSDGVWNQLSRSCYLFHAREASRACMYKPGGEPITRRGPRDLFFFFLDPNRSRGADLVWSS